jgi:hypothetical protein
MPRPLTRQQTLENRAFLRALRRTGNVRLAARETGLKYGTVQYRRAKHPAFAQAWDAALAFAQAGFSESGRQGPVGGTHMTTAKPLSACDNPHRTTGGEPVVVRRNDGKLQMRAAQPGKLTRQCEQAFLAALSATANVRLSAAAAGASVAAFYRRRRKNPAFAREMRLALEQGYARLEMALLESWRPESHADDAWRHNDPPPIPPMSANQALQLLYLHQKEARLIAEPDHIKRRKGESNEARSFRLSAMYEARLQRDREAFEVAEAARRARGEPGRWEETPPALPDLAQVTGWSNAKPRGAGEGEAEADRALFGGRRLGDLEGDSRKRP